MGERAQKVVIRKGRVSLYSTREGAQSCAEALIGGLSGLQADLAESTLTDEWWDPDFAEGGYLIDFDRNQILLYSWDQALIASRVSEVCAAWPDWSVEIVTQGVPDFQQHVARVPRSMGPAA